MKKRIFSLLLVIGLIASLSITAFAENFDGSVEFDGEKMTSDFTSADMSKAAADILPGGSMTYTIKISNADSVDVDFWMSNEIISSFEDNSVANGGAYAYSLTYTASDGSETSIYNSETVGGEKDDASDPEGLHDVTDALAELFYLETLAPEASGTVTLTVSLDGETQGNSYQDTLAELQLVFAAEETAANPDTPRKTVKTGDETNFVPYLIAAGASGLILLGFAVLSLKKHGRQQ